MYKIIFVDGFYKSQLNKKGKPDKYGEPMLFKDEKEAKDYIKRKTYPGMSFHYEIKEV